MKNLPCTFILFIWLSCQNNTDVPNKITTSCQKLATIIQTKGLDTLALRIGLDEAIVLSNSSIDRKHDSLISVVCRLEGLALSKQDRLTEARKYYESGIQIGRRHLSPTEDIIVRCYRNMGASYFKSDDYPNALRYYDSVQIIRSDSASLTMKVNNLIQSATCYQRLKDYYSAEKLASEACSTAQPFYSKSELAALYVQYAAILRSAHKYHASIEQAKKALSILIDFNKTSKLTIQDSATWADSYFYIAYALKDSGLYTLATPAYLRAIQLNQELGNIENQTTGLMNLSNTYRLAKQFDNAEKYLNQALQLLQKQPTLIDALIVRKGELYSGLDEVFMDKKEYSKALKAQESAINILTRYNESANLNALLSVHSYNLLQVLTDKAKTFAILAEKGVDTEGYQKALKLTDTIVALADDIRADYFSDDAKLTLANDIKPALEKAISLCQNLYKQTNNAEYLEKAFGFVEYSRSMVLYENARLANQLPADLKAENEQLKAQEAALVSKNNIEELQKYLQHKRQFREKIKALNKNKLASIKDLQSNLLTDDQTAFIEYFVGDSSIFTFVLLKNMIIPFEIKKN